MSVSISIFQKVCPACASNVSVSAETCSCGHRFESETEAGSSIEAALRDEELYETYLIARAEQAKQATLAAFEAHSADPSNASKTAALELSRGVAKEVEEDLRAQREKIAALRNANASPTPKSNPAPTGIPALSPSTARATPATTAPKPIAAKPAAPRTPAAHAPVVSAAPAAVTSKAAGVLSAIKNAKAREMPPVTPNTTPPAQFRHEQAGRADKVMETLASESGLNCPNCTATVPINTARCGCGYTFPTSGASDMPSLTLCTSDFTALRNNFLKDLNGRR